MESPESQVDKLKKGIEEAHQTKQGEQISVPVRIEIIRLFLEMDPFLINTLSVYCLYGRNINRKTQLLDKNYFPLMSFNLISSFSDGYIRFIQEEILPYTFLPTCLELYFTIEKNDKVIAQTTLDMISSAISIATTGSFYVNRTNVMYLLEPQTFESEVSKVQKEKAGKKKYSSRQLFILRAYSNKAYEFTRSQMDYLDQGISNHNIFIKYKEKTRLYLVSIQNLYDCKPFKAIENNILTLMILGFRPKEIAIIT